MNSFDVQTMISGYLETNMEINEKWIQELNGLKWPNFPGGEGKREMLKMIGAEKYKSPYDLRLTQSVK